VNVTTEASISALSEAAVREVARLRDEPAWLRERRLAAWERYRALPMPDPYQEEWRRLDHSRIGINGVRPFAPSPAGASRPQDLPAAMRALWDERDAASGRLIQHNSELVHAELDEALRARGVVFCDLHTAARDHGAVVRERLGTAVRDDDWKYVALNAALWSGGAFVYVPKGIEIELPLTFALGVTEPGLAAFPRVLVVADRDARVTLIDEEWSPTFEERGFASGVVELFAGDGAAIRYVNVQRWGRNVNNFVTVRGKLGRDAHVLAIMVGIGGDITRHTLEVTLDQPGARSEFLGLSFGDGTQHFDYTTLQDHIADHTVSDLLFKAALKDRAQDVWYGVVRIRPTAHSAEANQTSRNLLLSDHARAAPIPILEIEAWDVTRCSHGATAGPVDPEQLFYLQSRGIPRPEAERLLVEAFFAEVLDRIPSERLRTRVARALDEKLRGGHSQRGTLKGWRS
jgi:Fe-S cluster assembly protein SufD